MAKPWTKEEIEVLVQIVNSPARLKDSMKKLPGRTYASAMWKSKDVGVRAPSTANAIRNLMADGKERTAREIATELKFDKKRVGEFLRGAIAPGPEQEMHASDLRGGRHARVYVLGPGDNVGAPSGPIHVEEMSDEQLDRLHRASARGWPQADPVVISSINAMVRRGARA